MRPTARCATTACATDESLWTHSFTGSSSSSRMCCLSCPFWTTTLIAINSLSVVEKSQAAKCGSRYRSASRGRTRSLQMSTVDSDRSPS
eukprot:8708327-Heterocapsa_arctica.AAC.1